MHYTNTDNPIDFPKVNKPKCYQLIGVPGAGKSTWIKNQIWALGLTAVSTDTFVEDYAKAQSSRSNG